MENKFHLEDIYYTLTEALNNCYQMRNDGDISHGEYDAIAEAIGNACTIVLLAQKIGRAHV